MIDVLPAGTELRDEAGRLLATTTRDLRRSSNRSEDFVLPDGQHPAPMSLIDPGLIRAMRRAFAA